MHPALVHGNCGSEWVLWCFVRLHLCLKALVQAGNVHTNGRATGIGANTSNTLKLECKTKKGYNLSVLSRVTVLHGDMVIQVSNTCK